MLLELIIFLFSNMYCGASEMFLNPGGGEARGDDSYWSSFPFWMGSVRTVIPSDYIFRLLECNQGCDLLKMILLVFIVLMRNGSLSHCSRDFNIWNAFSALKKFGWKLREWWKDHGKLKVVLSGNFSSCSQYFQPAYMYMMPKSLEIFQE